MDLLHLSCFQKIEKIFTYTLQDTKKYSFIAFLCGVIKMNVRLNGILLLLALSSSNFNLSLAAGDLESQNQSTLASNGPRRGTRCKVIKCALIGAGLAGVSVGGYIVYDRFIKDQDIFNLNSDSAAPTMAPTPAPAVSNPDQGDTPNTPSIESVEVAKKVISNKLYGSPFEANDIDVFKHEVYANGEQSIMEFISDIYQTRYYGSGKFVFNNKGKIYIERGSRVDAYEPGESVSDFRALEVPQGAIKDLGVDRDNWVFVLTSQSLLIYSDTEELELNLSLGQLQYDRIEVSTDNTYLIFLMDTDNGIIDQYNLNDILRENRLSGSTRIASFGSGDGQVNRPQGMAYDENESKLYVADSFNNRIQVLDGRTGSFVKEITHLSESEKMFLPVDVALGSSKIYVLTNKESASYSGGQFTAVYDK